MATRVVRTIRGSELGIENSAHEIVCGDARIWVRITPQRWAPTEVYVGQRVEITRLDDSGLLPSRQAALAYALEVIEDWTRLPDPPACRPRGRVRSQARPGGAPARGPTTGSLSLRLVTPVPVSANPHSATYTLHVPLAPRGIPQQR